jgi:hypothetical protein
MQQRILTEQDDPRLANLPAFPTMYDLPSEDPEEPGLPDDYHDLQPQLLSRTLRLSGYREEEIYQSRSSCRKREINAGRLLYCCRKFCIRL